MSKLYMEAKQLSRRSFFAYVGRFGMLAAAATGFGGGILQVLTSPITARAEPCSCGYGCLSPCASCPPWSECQICCTWSDCSCGLWSCCCYVGNYTPYWTSLQAYKFNPTVACACYSPC